MPSTLSSLKRKLRRKKSELKFMLLIAVICLIVAFFISIVAGNLPLFFERVISEQVKGTIQREVHEAEKEISTSPDLERLIREYKKQEK